MFPSDAGADSPTHNSTVAVMHQTRLTGILYQNKTCRLYITRANMHRESTLAARIHSSSL